ncbi:MAG: hypothetical protein C0467_10860 [Planctomycetaceae bacterium]|nr:hypothetical protein [Planctomycetaceae bacterium]
MRGMRFAVAGFLVVGMVSLAQAQFRPGGFGGGPTSLVTNKAVQEDLKLSEDQITKLKEWSTEFRKKSAEIMKDKGIDFGKGGFGKIEPEMREKLDAANAEITKEAYKQLGEVLKKEQVERLKQISRQQMGANAFTNAEVVDALKLTAAQKDSVKGVTGDLQKETREIFGEFTKGKFDVEKMQENQKKVQKLQKEYIGKLEDLLDDSQKKTWKEMKGEAFDLAKLQPQFPKKKD